MNGKTDEHFKLLLQLMELVSITPYSFARKLYKVSSSFYAMERRSWISFGDPGSSLFFCMPCPGFSRFDHTKSESKVSDSTDLLLVSVIESQNSCGPHD